MNKITTKKELLQQDWSIIKHLFVWEGRCVVVIDGFGQVKLKRLKPKEIHINEFVEFWNKL